MLSWFEARSQILDTIRAKVHLLPLARAAGCFSGTDIAAPMLLPSWDNSAMDGYAIRCAEVPGTLPVVGTIAAGEPPGQSLEPGTALQIMTGAPLPHGADAVVAQENVERSGERASFAGSARHGQHIRRAGEDIRPGDIAVPKGSRLGPGELGLLASLGLTEISVGRAPSVALLATGNELVPVGTAPSPGQRINSNALALATMVEEAGGKVVSSTIAADNQAAVISALRHALSADILISCGGVSVGKFDLVKDCMKPAGIELEFWRVAIKPGKPMVFGHAGETLFFGLPGNPASAMVCFELFIRPSLRSLQAAQQIFRPTEQVLLSQDYEKRPGRAHFLCAKLQQSAEGYRIADIDRGHSSGQLSSLTAVDALIEIPADAIRVAKGKSTTAHLVAWSERTIRSHS